MYIVKNFHGILSAFKGCLGMTDLLSIALFSPVIWINYETCVVRHCEVIQPLNFEVYLILEESIHLRQWENQSKL